jgi:phage terminase large subunit
MLLNEFKRTTAINKLSQLKARKRIVQGGTSAGKTFGILPLLINSATQRPNLEISVVSESIPHLRRGALKDFLKIMMWTGRYVDSRYNKTLLTYTFANGSFIEFFSADQPDKLRGARRNMLYINECNNVDFESYYQLAIRTDGTIWLDFNPTNEFWVHKEVLSEPDAERIVLTYLDNEALSETTKGEIELNREKAKTSDYWANWWKVYGLGEIGNILGTVFTNYKIVDHIHEEAELVGYGLDFGYQNDPAALTAIYKIGERYIFDELIYRKGLINSELSNIMNSIGVVRGKNIYADSAEPKSISELRQYGWNVKNAVKGKDSVNYGIQLMQNDEFYVTSRSVNLINELRNYKWDVDSSGKSLNKPIDAFNHSIDSLRYYFTSHKKSSGNYQFERS